MGFEVTREKSINFDFIMVPLREKSIKVWYSKAQLRGPKGYYKTLRVWGLAFGVYGVRPRV